MKEGLGCRAGRETVFALPGTRGHRLLGEGSLEIQGFLRGGSSMLPEGGHHASTEPTKSHREDRMTREEPSLQGVTEDCS